MGIGRTRMDRRWLAAGVIALAALIGYATPSRADADNDLKTALSELVSANHILYDQNVFDGYGHISVRNPKDPNHFFMSRAVAPGMVTAADIMEFDLDAVPLDRQGREIYIERFIHSEIYKRRADVNAVIHSHSPTVIPFSIAQTTLKPVFHDASFLYTGAPVFDVRTAAGDGTNLLVMTPALGKALAESLGNNAVVLIRGHGEAVVGPSIHVVVSRAIYTEENAKLQMQALALGGPLNYLTPAEGEKVETLANSGGLWRVWNMWVAKAEKDLR